MPSTPNAPDRLSDRPRPERYRLQVKVDPRRKPYSGQVCIELRETEGLREIELHAQGLELGKVELGTARGDVAVAGVELDPARERAVVRLADAIPTPRAELRIAFRGTLREDLRGLYHARSGKHQYAVTQFEAADARRFFPCFDEPDRKARFELSVTAPKGMQTISNAPVRRRERKGSLETTHFAETPPLSTYLVALIVGALEGSKARRAGKTPIRVWAVPGRKAQMAFGLEAAAEALTRLERYFGLPYPYAKLDLIAVPDFEFGAMENAGAVTFRETLLLVDPKTISLAERKRVAEVIAHELAHMWFGDLVTMEWWDDLWLNESFATWMAFSIVDDWRPEWKMWLDFQHARSSAFGLDALENTHPVYVEVKAVQQALENFDLITYEKGASVVRMIERWLGDATFRRGVRSYIRRHREGNARAADLWTALEQAAKRPVAPVVRSWLERPGFPMVDVRRTDAGVELAQQRFFANPALIDGASEPPWPIPMRLRVRPARGKARTTSVLLEKASDRVALETTDARWLYANGEESGFYRPLHSAELLSALATHIQELEPVERMGLIQHQWAGVRAERAPLESVLQLADALRDEREPEVLGALLSPLLWLADQVVSELAPPESERFALWLRQRFAPELRSLGLDPRRKEPDSARQLRAQLLAIVGGVAEDPETLAGVESRIGPYLRDRAALDPNLAPGVVRLAARHGSKSRHDAYVRCMRNAATAQERTRFLLALAEFRDPALVERTLSLALSLRVPTQDVVPLLARLFDNPAGRDRTWDFIRNRWDALAPRVPAGLASRLVSAVSALRTPGRRAEIVAFFETNPVPSAARALRQALERLDLDTRLRAHLAPQLADFLRGASAEAR